MTAAPRGSMPVTPLLARLTAVLAAAAIAACSTEPYELTSEEHDYGWRHQAYRSLLVVGVYPDLQLRQAAEIAFAYELSRREVAAMRSLERPGGEAAAVVRNPAGAGVEGMLTIATVPAAAAARLQRALERQGPDHLVELARRDRVAREDVGLYAAPGKRILHVALWDAETLRPVWQATTDSYGEVPAENQINALALDIVGTLRRRNLI
jgi:hypothetical protein